MLTLVYPYGQIRVTGDRRWTARLLTRIANRVLSGVEADEFVWTLAALSDPRALGLAASRHGLGASPTSPRRAT